MMMMMVVVMVVGPGGIGISTSLGIRNSICIN